MEKFNQVPVIGQANMIIMHYFPKLFTLGLNAFLYKPLEIEDYIEAYVKTIDYWMNCHPNHHE